tara:strand:+ start:75 stop:1844 length:1770 start_codon:yes stop_codon:yes gene_type:complete
MRKQISFLALIFFIPFLSFSQINTKLKIQGILDLYGSGSSIYTGDDGKGIHLRAIEAIEDLSEYALSVANNGGGSDGPEYYLSGSVSAGDDILVYKIGNGSNSADFFSDYFGSCYGLFELKIPTGQNFPDGNGDDPVELFHNDIVIDYYGDVDGSAISGDPYEDGWTYRNPDGSWLDGGKDCDVESNEEYSVLTSGCPYPLCEEQPILEKTFVPDDNFEAYLEENGMGDGVANNDSVLTSNISDVMRLEISGNEITDLIGIQDFEALHYLNAGGNSINSVNLTQNILLDTLGLNGNQLSSINISSNTNLLYLDVEDNQLTNLDVSNNQLLTILSCASNQLVNLDISSNINLIEIYAFENQITSIDLSQNPLLVHINFEINQLSCLNLKNGNNNSIAELWTQNNPNLVCIEVDDTDYSNTNWLNNDDFYIGDSQYFSINCNYSTGCFGECDSTVLVYDTVTVYDTIITSVYDTSYVSITIIDTLFSDTLYIDVPVTNGGVIMSNTILVYPNPANDFVIIDNGSFDNLMDIFLEIVNAVGQIVFNSEIDTQFLSGQTFNIPITEIGPPGNYFIYVKDSTNNIIAIKYLILN